VANIFAREVAKAFLQGFGTATTRRAGSGKESKFLGD